MIRNLSTAACLITALTFPCALAGEAVGFAQVNGSYRVNGSGVRGNVTLFDGAEIETINAPVKIQLSSGARVWLAPQSASIVSMKGVLLLRGSSRLNGNAGHGISARAVNVTAAAPHSVVQVNLDRADGTIVAPLEGAVEVTNARGVRVGTLAAGAVVRYANERGSQSAVQVTGCLSRQAGRLRIEDEITRVAMVVEGGALEKQAGRAVRVSGMVSGAVDGMPLVRATSVAPAQTDCGSGPVLLAAAAPMAAAPQDVPVRPQMLTIVIVEGEGAINNIRQRIGREPVVQVEDENRRPVAGALVTFTLPSSGPGAVFPNGARVLTVTTDAQGRAVGRGLQPNKQAGQYQIAVSATHAGLTAAATVTQINALGAIAAGAAGAGAAAGLSAGAKVAIIGGVSAAAVVGGLAAAGTLGGGEDEPTASR